MARSVRDVALALTILSGPDGRDPYAMPIRPPRCPEGEADLAGLRVGWLAGEEFGRVDPDVAATVARAADVLSALGCRVEHANIRGLECLDCNTLTATLFRAEAGLCFESAVAGRHADLHSTTRRHLEAPTSTFHEYLVALAELERLRYDLIASFEHHDLLLCPASPAPAFPHGAEQLVIDDVTLPLRHVVRPTAPFNVTGSPALSVPFGWSREGLPIGVQVVGRHWDEESLLRVGMALERHWESRHPVV